MCPNLNASPTTAVLLAYLASMDFERFEYLRSPVQRGPTSWTAGREPGLMKNCRPVRLKGMRSIRAGIVAVAPIALAALMLSGCGSSSPTDRSDQDPPSTSAPSDPNSTESSSPDGEASSDGCWVHLYDADNFKESDDHFRLTEAGKYENLAQLPGADTDWTDEADSLKVGPNATVTIWPETDFAGTAQTLDPGSEHPSVDEPSSLEMTCTE